MAAETPLGETRAGAIGVRATVARVGRPGSVLRWVLRGQRRALLLWAVAVALVSGIYAGFYELLDVAEMEALVDSMPPGLAAAMGYDQLGTATGYLEFTVYGLLGPILVLVFAIGFAARTLAGQEEDGSLELEVTAAVGRRRVLLERYAALVVQVAVLVAAITAVVGVLVAAIDMPVGAVGLAAAGLGMLLLVLAIASVTFATGAVTGRRAIALAVGAVVAVGGFVADALADLLDDGRWMEALSPFSWYLSGDPLAEGVDVVGFAALLGLSVVAVAVAVPAFERRDLGV